MLNTRGGVMLPLALCHTDTKKVGSVQYYKFRVFDVDV